MKGWMKRERGGRRKGKWGNKRKSKTDMERVAKRSEWREGGRGTGEKAEEMEGRRESKGSSYRNTDCHHMDCQNSGLIPYLQPGIFRSGDPFGS